MGAMVGRRGCDSEITNPILAVFSLGYLVITLFKYLSFLSPYCMPSFSAPSAIRVASQDHALRLKITHNLVHGSPSDTVHSVKGRLPKELDVLWLSDIAISLSGSLDGHQIPAHDVVRSGLVHHLHVQLRAACFICSTTFPNPRAHFSSRTQIGLASTTCHILLWMMQTAFPNVGSKSLLSLPGSDSVSLVTLTPSRPLPYASRPHANLVSLHLAYIWRTVAGRSDTIDSGHLVEETNPFSSTLFLPAEALLNRLTEQFLTYHLARSVPI